jgi:hypothetical protein
VRNARAYTSARSIGFCALLICISSSSRGFARSASQVIDRCAQANARSTAQVLGRGTGAVARGAARSFSQVLDRGAQVAARGAATLSQQEKKKSLDA